MLALPLMIIGAGALGGSILKGLRVTTTVDPSDVIILDLHPQAEAQAYGELGARLNPEADVLAEARTVIVAVKPQGWRAVAEAFGDKLRADAVIVSVMAGVRTTDLSAAFGARKVARVMPTTGVATGKGVASLYAAESEALEAAKCIFEPIASTVVLGDEGLIDAATAVSGSGPAYVYAFAAALEAAGLEAGLEADDARVLARATLISAANLLDISGEEPEALIKKVASPGGTTEAGLKFLRAEGQGLNELITATVLAAQKRSRELG
ncbi:pyrroline-5-carboxylate reductase [Asticcacaulis tiandongensis]|uniref:pyrroline-5-carboxylate reductase n=1 Tax=Asticcacaulis tiandongensis TaxID=2565365 RepID=UPI0011281C97|nr:pyrroline-5-carboxylate reductase [Asticcacaulis tiandongensis]